jgi:hypothetical protein
MSATYANGPDYCDIKSNNLTMLPLIASIAEQNNQAVLLMSENRWRESMQLFCHAVRELKSMSSLSSPTLPISPKNTINFGSFSCSQVKVRMMILNNIDRDMPDANTSGDYTLYNCAFLLRTECSTTPSPTDIATATALAATPTQCVPQSTNATNDAMHATHSLHCTTVVMLYNLGLLYHVMGVTQNGFSLDKTTPALSLYESCLALMECTNGCSLDVVRSWFWYECRSMRIVLVAILNNMGHIYSTQFDWSHLSSIGQLLRFSIERMTDCRYASRAPWLVYHLSHQMHNISLDDDIEHERLFLSYFQTQAPSTLSRTHAPSA